ncbi:O-antigen ligase family protein [Fusobacterium polymorphum]
MSIIAIYSLFSITLIKNKLLRIIIIILSLFIILVGGKFTAILAILISLMIYLLIIKLSIFKSKLKFILKTILVISFSSSFIFYCLIRILNELFSVKNIFSGRSVLWLDYINYILENKLSLLFGNGFFSDSKMISYLSHPHNQYLTILYTLGIFGFVIYYSLFSKSIDRILKVVRKYPDLLLLFIIQIIQMCGDDYYILTVEPIGMIFIFLIYNIKYAKKRVIIGEINE